jgi:nucleotide-binding universal stress UspA family protein
MTTRWTLGLDLREGAEGPLVFARWLVSELTRHGTSTELDPVHVIEQDQIGLLTTAERREEVIALAEDAVVAAVRRSGGETPLVGLRLVDVGEPEDVLADAGKQSEGLIIGRLAPRGRDKIFRLGGVARRLLRRLTAPTVVVPPDLAASQIGKGPIVFACDGDDDSLGAARFATKLADSLRRELVLAHVVPMPYGWSVGYLPSDALKQVRADLQTRGERTLERWATKHGLHGLRGFVREGIVAEELTRLASEQDALMLIVGSRKLNAIERLFVTSVGSELAASATCPVAVVPPDHGS